MIMYSGTTDDHFLWNNLEWLSWATNWAKLSATDTIGVILRGHEKGVADAVLPSQGPAPARAARR